MNVLFLAIDDMNPIIGAYGNPLIQTPNMDRLASKGMLFENAHCQYSVCGPSRASLMTGLMPDQTGVIGFLKMRGLSANGERDNPKGVANLVTIPQHFIMHGYETAASGKINDFRCVGSINSDGTINEDGGSVDDPLSWSLGFQRGLGNGHVKPTEAERDGKTVRLAAEGPDQPASEFLDYYVASEGITQLRTLAAGNKPFFLGVGFHKPHTPFLAPKSNWDQYDRDDFVPHPFQTEMKYATRYTFNNIREVHGYYLETDEEGNALPITTDILPEEHQKTLLHGYYACISHIDEQVGRVLDELDTLGLAENTIVVLWGDHGFHLGDHNEWGKHTNLEQATRVPLIIRVPGFPEGEVTQAPVGLIDLFPTLCELAGLPQPVQPANVDSAPEDRPLSGISLVPVLQDSDARVRSGIMNMFRNRQAATNNYGYAYRTERYRYTEWIGESETILARELYDYEWDPMETINVAGLPEYESLLYQFSVATRSPAEATGNLRVENSFAMPFPSNTRLPNFTGELTSNNLFLLKWDAAPTVRYNVMSSSNLEEGSWTPYMSDVSGNSVGLPIDSKSRFFRVHLAP